MSGLCISVEKSSVCGSDATSQLQPLDVPSPLVLSPLPWDSSLHACPLLFLCSYKRSAILSPFSEPSGLFFMLPSECDDLLFRRNLAWISSGNARNCELTCRKSACLRDQMLPFRKKKCI